MLSFLKKLRNRLLALVSRVTSFDYRGKTRHYLIAFFGDYQDMPPKPGNRLIKQWEDLAWHYFVPTFMPHGEDFDRIVTQYRHGPTRVISSTIIHGKEFSISTLLWAFIARSSYQKVTDLLRDYYPPARPGGLAINFQVERLRLEIDPTASSLYKGRHRALKPNYSKAARLAFVERLEELVRIITDYRPWRDQYAMSTVPGRLAYCGLVLWFLYVRYRFYCFNTLLSKLLITLYGDGGE